MASNIKNIRKLQTAINSISEDKILYQTTQFWTPCDKRAIQKYIIRRSVFNPYTERYDAEEIFSTYSQLQVILFLRDYLFTLQGKELPTDNKLWNEIKEKNNITFEEVRK